MVDEILSQEEIDKLLNVPGLGPDGGVELNTKELERVTDIVRSVFKATGATLGMTTGRKVKVTGGTKGKMIPPADIDSESAVILHAPLSEGFTGELHLYLPLSAATALVDLILGGEGEAKTSLDETDVNVLQDTFTHLLNDSIPATLDATGVKVGFDALTVEQLEQGALTRGITVRGEKIYACKGDINVTGIKNFALYALFSAPMAANIVYTLAPFKATKRRTSAATAASPKPDATTKPTSQPQPAPAQAEAATSEELGNIELIMELEVEVMVRLGNAEMALKDIQKLRPGSIIDLDRETNAPVELVVNDRVIARGELVVTDEDALALRVTEIKTPKERIRSLGS